MSWLLDGNTLLALTLRGHEFHEAAHRWFGQGRPFATCPITQGTLLRLHPRLSGDPSLSVAWQSLESFVAHPQHAFWADELSYTAVSSRGLLGGAQVTDAYLAALARHYQGRVATFDAAFARQHPDVVSKIDAL